MTCGVPVMRSALLFGVLLTACSVGEVSGTGAVADGGGTMADGGGTACLDRLVPAAAAHDHGNTPGNTNAGLGCVVAACHFPGNTGTGAPEYRFAGTVYKTGGTTPSAGAVVRVKAADGTEYKGYTDSAGNFSILASAAPATAFPATTSTTACPTATPMVGQLQPMGGGNCNAEGCHGSTMRITLADQ
jgi:hypothetical protein